MMIAAPVLAEQTTTLTDLGKQLTNAKLKKVAGILDELEQHGGDKVLPLFEALLAGNLYYVITDRALVILSKGNPGNEENIVVTDALTTENQYTYNKAALKKVRVNNKLRGILRGKIAELTLSSSDPALRESAVNNMLQKPDEESITLLRNARQFETSPDILEKIDLALMIASLDSSNDVERLAAIESLQDSLEPVVRNRLQLLVEIDDKGNFLETNTSIIAAATSALKKIDGKLRYYGFIERVFFGLSLGSVLLLAAIGLSITFGVMGGLFLYDPVRWSQTLGIEALTDAGKVDIRATYGGGMLALALFWFWCALDPSRGPAGLWSMALVYGGLALGRSLGWLAGHRLDRKMTVFLVFEVFAVGLCVAIIAGV